MIPNRLAMPGLSTQIPSLIRTGVLLVVISTRPAPVTARGTPCDHHPNVVFLRVHSGRFDWLFALLDFLLPTAWRDWLESRHPEFFLPPKVVMKREKVGWEEEFENEKRIYQALASIQGTVVSRFYGEVECPGTKRACICALIISDVGGVGLSDAPGLDIRHLEVMHSKSIRAVAHFKAGQGNPKLDNYMLVGDKIMVIDFDTAYMLDQGEPDVEAGYDVAHLCWTYQSIDWDDD